MPGTKTATECSTINLLADFLQPDGSEVVTVGEIKEKFVVPFAVILPIAILVLIYWTKLKSYLSAKVIMMKTENNIEKGKHAGAIIICDTIKVLFTIIPFALFYVLIVGLEKYVDRLSDIFLFMILCEALGGILAIFDTINNVIDFNDAEVKELENEVLESNEK